VTGGAGFIGSALVKKLAENPQNFLVAVDNLLTGSSKRLVKKDNVVFIKADVNDYMDISSIFHRFRFDYVFHYAAVVGVKRTLENPVLVLEDLSGIKNILNLCKNTGVKRIFFSSSSEVYGEPVELPQNEHTTPLNSRLPYAIVKNVGEAFLKSYQQEFDLNYTVFRFFNTYGPMQSKDFVISKFVNAALKNEDITIFGDGTQTRSFQYVDDLVEGTIRMMSSRDGFVGPVNIGNPTEFTMLELAEKIIELTNSKSKLVYMPLPQDDPLQRQPVIDLAKKELNGWEPKVQLAEGLTKTISYFDNLLKSDS
jgi:UDP-glucose 4-epimerase